MGGEHDCAAAIALFEDETAKLQTGGHIQAGNRLVEDEQHRLGQQRDGETETLAHATGERADLLIGVFAEADGIDERAGASSGDALQVGVEEGGLGDREVRVECRALGR